MDFLSFFVKCIPSALYFWMPHLFKSWKACFYSCSLIECPCSCSLSLNSSFCCSNLAFDFGSLRFSFTSKGATFPSASLSGRITVSTKAAWSSYITTALGWPEDTPLCNVNQTSLSTSVLSFTSRFFPKCFQVCWFVLFMSVILVWSLCVCETSKII